MNLKKIKHWLSGGTVDKKALDRAAQAREKGEHFHDLAKRLSRLLGGR